MTKKFKKTVNPKLNVQIKNAKEIKDETPEERNENFKQFVYYALDMICGELDAMAEKLYKITEVHNAILKMVCSECDEEDCEDCHIPEAHV